MSTEDYLNNAPDSDFTPKKRPEPADLLEIATEIVLGIHASNDSALGQVKWVKDRIFAALADERERCAKIADRYATRPEIAAAIRSQKG